MSSMLTDDTRIQVIAPDNPARWVTLGELRKWLGANQQPAAELTPAVKASITRAVKKAVKDEQSN